MATLPILSVDQILSAPDRDAKLVEVPQWGGAVKIVPLSKGLQRAVREKSKKWEIKDGRRVHELDADAFERNLWLESVAEPKFTEAQYDALKDKNFAAQEVVLREILAINGMAEGAVREAQKSFPPGPA
jgi:hypothetical protein